MVFTIRSTATSQKISSARLKEINPFVVHSIFEKCYFKKKTYVLEQISNEINIKQV